jgi:siderophore synthetase component
LELAQAGLRWFDAYWKCAIEAPIRIYDRHGIGLEAHQQNSLIEFEPSGLPRRSYYRDIQGVGLSECFYSELVARIPELARQTKVFESDDIVRNGLGYYLVFNQLFAVINRFALDGLLYETQLLNVVRKKLLELRPRLGKLGTAFVDTLLETQAIPCKANLLTRVADMDELEAENELAVYTLIDNPLRAPEQPHAAARVMALATHELFAPDQA